MAARAVLRAIRVKTQATAVNRHPSAIIAAARVRMANGVTPAMVMTSAATTTCVVPSIRTKRQPIAKQAAKVTRAVERNTALCRQATVSVASVSMAVKATPVQATQTTVHRTFTVVRLNFARSALKATPVPIPSSAALRPPSAQPSESAKTGWHRTFAGAMMTVGRDALLRVCAATENRLPNREISCFLSPAPN